MNRTGEEFGHRIDQRLCIRCAGCLKSGVHCQLGQADIYGVQTEMSVYEVAEGGAAADIGLVGEFLERRICPAADFLEDRGAYRIRAVQLCTGMLDDNAAVELRTQIGICLFRIVWMHGVRVVGTYDKRVRKDRIYLVIPDLKSAENPVEHIVQEGSRRTLLCKRADFLIVKQRKDRKGCSFFCIQESHEIPKSALQVIEPRGTQIFILRTEDEPRCALCQEEIIAQHIGFFTAGFLCNQFQEGSIG